MYRANRLSVALLALAGVSAAYAQADQLQGLIAEFRNDESFSEQLRAGERIAELADPRALVALEPWLRHEDRHVRGNVAFVYAKLGDPRGFSTLVDILDDFSASRRVEWPGESLSVGADETEEQAVARYSRSPAWLRTQIRSDRYYAVHLLGKLRDPRAIDVLLPLLSDEDINYNVAWALGEIGDERAIPGLIEALSNKRALVRSIAINALVKLRATEARPYIEALLSDPAVPNAGDPIPVSATARTALESLASEHE